MSTLIAMRPCAAPTPTTAMRWTRRAGKLAAAATVALTASACANFLPQTGPTTGDILDGDPRQTVDYALVSLDAKAAMAARAADPRPFDEAGFRNAHPLRTSLIGAGDVLSIAIWEPVEDGLLTAAGAKQAVIEQVEVDDRGNVFVPYAGLIRASGRTTGSLRAAIVERLKDKTTDPQVTVSRATYRSRGVALQGSVGSAGIQPIEPLTGRLLPMLAAAGGVSTSPSQTKITVRRRGASTSGFLDSIYEDPTANIALRSGDIVLVQEKPRFYNAFGSVGGSGRQPLSSGMSLLDAITQAGGLSAQTANPTGVFVFRDEPETVVSQLTPIEFKRKVDEAGLTQLGSNRQVVYQLELNTADAMFVADAFMMREGDTIYVTEAPYSQFRKVLSVIIPALGTAGSVNSLAAQ